MDGTSGADVQSGSLLTDCKGGRFGGYFRIGANDIGFDAYCMVGFNEELSDAEADSVSSFLMNHFGLSKFKKNLILESANITVGIAEFGSADNVSMALAEPCAELIPADV